MITSKRGCGARRGMSLCAVAALAIALSGCGGGSQGASAAVSTAQSSTPAQSSPPTQSVTPTQGSTPTPAQGTSTGSGTPPASTGTAPTSSNPPTASIGNVTINWMPPTQNTDGTALTDLAGYNIHYGTASGKYTQTISVNNPGLATYVVQNLSPGTYYFSVAAVNSAGTESPLSSEVSTTVN